MIFVSHARKDKPVVDYFVEKVLQVGFGISPSYIFYSSHPDTGISGGDYINGTIFNHIRDSSLIIIFLSKHYFDSAYCLCEMGASRLLLDEKKIFLFIFPDLSYRDVKGVFVENMIKKIDNEGMDCLIDAVHKACPQIITSRPSAPKRRIDEFLSSFHKKAAKILPPTNVSFDEFEKVKQKCAELTLDLNQVDEENAKQKTYIAKLEKLKDAKKVKQIKPIKTKKVEEAYEELRIATESELSQLTKYGKMAMFYFWKYGEDNANRRINNEHLEIDIDIDDNFFCYSGESIELGDNSDGIWNSIKNLSNFLEGNDLERICAKYGFKEDDWHEFRKSLPAKPLNDNTYWRENLF